MSVQAWDRQFAALAEDIAAIASQQRPATEDPAEQKIGQLQEQLKGAARELAQQVAFLLTYGKKSAAYQGKDWAMVQWAARFAQNASDFWHQYRREASDFFWAKLVYLRASTISQTYRLPLPAGEAGNGGPAWTLHQARTALTVAENAQRERLAQLHQQQQVQRTRYVEVAIERENGAAASGGWQTSAQVEQLAATLRRRQRAATLESRLHRSSARWESLVASAWERSQRRGLWGEGPGVAHPLRGFDFLHLAER